VTRSAGFGQDVERGPDSTAVTTALWRGAHLRLDTPPHIVEDDIGWRLLRDTDVLARYVGPGVAVGPDVWLSHPYMGEKFRQARAGAVARARLVDDIVAECADRGLDQNVILGAGLDSFAFRHISLVRKLRVFGVDEPGTQAWKRRRLHELGMNPPETLSFVPVDFERQSWVEEIAKAGFDRGRPAVVCSLGVTQYLSVDAIQAMLREVAGLARRTTIVCSFVLPAPLIEPDANHAVLIRDTLVRLSARPSDRRTARGVRRGKRTANSPAIVVLSTPGKPLGTISRSSRQRPTEC